MLGECYLSMKKILLFLSCFVFLGCFNSAYATKIENFLAYLNKEDAIQDYNTKYQNTAGQRLLNEELPFPIPDITVDADVLFLNSYYAAKTNKDLPYLFTLGKLYNLLPEIREQKKMRIKSNPEEFPFKADVVPCIFINLSHIPEGKFRDCCKRKALLLFMDLGYWGNNAVYIFEDKSPYEMLENHRKLQSNLNS